MEPLENGYLEQVSNIIIILYWIVFVLGLFGNFLVIIVILTYAKMKTVTNIYIFNLALIDCLSMFMIPMFLQHKWIFGATICKFYVLLMSVLDFSGSFLVAALSVDRYFGVCKPHSAVNIRTLLGSSVINVLIWIMSVFFSLPLYHFAMTKNSDGNETCKVYWPDVDSINGTKVQFLYSFAFGFLIPFSVIVIFYFLILWKLRHLYSAKGRSRRRRVTFLVLTLITVYFICWLPYWVGHIIFAFFEDRSSNPMAVFTLVASWLSFANSAVNPILYAFTNKNFNDSFLKLITCGKRKEESKLSHQHTGGLSYYGSAKTEPSHSFVFQSTFEGMNYPSASDE